MLPKFASCFATPGIQAVDMNSGSDYGNTRGEQDHKINSS